MSDPLLREVMAADVPWPSHLLEFLSVCGGPTWITQPGRDQSRRRVVTTLLHGNEPSGSVAVARWLSSGRVPAVNTMFYIASVDAALTEPPLSHRSLAGSPDANRTYRAPYDGRPGQLALQVLERVRHAKPEALVDLHNNTGHNPAYGVVTRIDTPALALTALFASRVVHSDLSLGTLVEATSAWCPSIVIECGRAGDAQADETAWLGLERFLTLPRLPLHQAPSGGLEVLRKPIRVSIKPDTTLAIARSPQHTAQLTVDAGLETFNFRAMPEGSVIGWVRAAEPGVELPLTAIGAEGVDIAPQLFTRHGDQIMTRRPIVPVMMTIRPEIALSDCLFYATEAQSP